MQAWRSEIGSRRQQQLRPVRGKSGDLHGQPVGYDLRRLLG